MAMMARRKSPAQLDVEIEAALKRPRSSKKTAEAEKLGAVREVFDGAAATLLDRFFLDGIEIPSIDRNDYRNLLGAIGFVADVMDPRSTDPIERQFVREYTALVDRGLAPRRFR